MLAAHTSIARYEEYCCWASKQWTRDTTSPDLPPPPQNQGPLNGGVSNGGASRSGLVLLFCPFLSFWDFPDFSRIFPICSGMVRGFSRFVLFLFLGLLRVPTRNSPERVRDTIWTFPQNSGKPPGLETPRFSFSQQKENRA